jgi:hypothetical protein
MVAADDRRDSRFAAFDNKLTEAQTRIDGLLATLPKQIDDLSRKLEEFRGLEPRLDRALTDGRALDKVIRDVQAVAPRGNLRSLLMFYSWNAVLWACSLLLSIVALTLSFRRWEQDSEHFSCRPRTHRRRCRRLPSIARTRFEGRRA